MTPRTDVERLFYELAFVREGEDLRMVTVRGRPAERQAAAKRIRDAFLAHGYTGIRTDYDGGETVVFDPRAIRSVRRIAGPARGRR